MRRSKLIAALTAEHGLVVVGPEALTIRRVRRGKGFSYRTSSGAVLRRADDIARLRSLAMPPPRVSAGPICWPSGRAARPVVAPAVGVG